MEPVIFPIDERLADPGDTTPVRGHIDQDTYTLGEHEFKLPNGMDYDVVLTNAGEGILASGLLKAHVEGTCDRCLEPAEFEVAGEVDEYYLFEEPVNEDGSASDEEDEVDYSLVGDDETVDLTAALQSALIMETPYVVLCTPDCKGLCPTCGANLNLGDCGCAERREVASLDESPFAVLKDLKLDDGDVSEK